MAGSTLGAVPKICSEGDSSLVQYCAQMRDKDSPSMLLPRSSPGHSDAHISLQFQVWVCRVGNSELTESCGCHAASKHHPNSPFSFFKYITLSFPVSFPLSVPISREAMEAHHLSEVSSLPQLITCPQAMKQPEEQYRHLLGQAGGKKTFYLHCCPSSLPGRGAKGQEHNNRKCKVC